MRRRNRCGGRRDRRQGCDTERDIAVKASALVLLTSAFVWLVAAPASADWLITRDGRLIETHGPWSALGPFVTYTTVEGQPQSTPVIELDLEASAAASDRPTGVSVTTEEPRGGNDSTGAGVPQSVSEDEQTRRRRFSDRLGVQFNVRTTWYDNYFRASPDDEHVNVGETLTQGQLRWTMSEDRSLETYVEIGRTMFDSEQLGAVMSYRGGVMLNRDRHFLDVWTMLETGRVELDIGDTVDAGDILIFSGRYSFRATEDWQFTMKGLFLDQSVDDPTNDSQITDAGASVRYRGFGRTISPEVGALWRRYNRVGPDDYGEKRVFLRLRFYPARTFNFSVRYRHRLRRYGVLDPAVSNFGRQDTRRKWTLLANVMLRRNLALYLSYNNLDSDSTRLGRSFKTQDLGFGLRVRAWEPQVQTGSSN